MEENKKDLSITETGEADAGSEASMKMDENDQVPDCEGEDGAKEQPGQELEEYKKKSEEYYERLLRLQADFENYRKRVAREKEEIYNHITGEVLTQFLGVLDNMERALEAADSENHSDAEAVRQGIGMVIKQFNDILGKYEVSEIDALGEEFNPNRHYAVMQVEDSGEKEGTVVEVLQKGYAQKSRVLRPSMVKVAK